MRHPSLAILILSIFVIGCGGETRDAAPPQGELAASDAPAAGSPGKTTETVASPAEPVASRPLTPTERKRLRMIATSVGAAIDLFDTTVLACPDAGSEGCFDRAWSVLFWAMDWPPFYLRGLDARTRGCESLAVAVKGLNSFNLAARQLDYGDLAEVGTAIGRRDRLMLVDTLRPSPSELRIAASACH